MYFAAVPAHATPRECISGSLRCRDHSARAGLPVRSSARPSLIYLGAHRHSPGYKDLRPNIHSPLPVNESSRSPARGLHPRLPMSVPSSRGLLCRHFAPHDAHPSSKIGGIQIVARIFGFIGERENLANVLIAEALLHLGRRYLIRRYLPSGSQDSLQGLPC